jgi:hypothetical protein
MVVSGLYAVGQQYLYFKSMLISVEGYNETGRAARFLDAIVPCSRYVPSPIEPINRYASMGR